jgi:hypothetical protein
MKITATGKIAGRPASVAWENGLLSGDAGALSNVAVLVVEHVDVALAGFGGGPAALDGRDPVITAATLAAALDVCDGIDGLEADALPDGAVA